MKTTKIKTADARIEIRVWKDDKVQFTDKAKGLGLTLTELIILLLKGKEIPDRKNQEQMYNRLSNITREMNMIGKNINQITVAIHQINNSNKIEMGEFRAITNLLKIYAEQREILRLILDKIVF